jgi:hypothetical protein
MCDREVLNAQMRGHLVVEDTIYDGGKGSEQHDPDDFQKITPLKLAVVADRRSSSVRCTNQRVC